MLNKTEYKVNIYKKYIIYIIIKQSNIYKQSKASWEDDLAE